MYTRCLHKRKQVYYGRAAYAQKFMNRTKHLMSSIAICTKDRNKSLLETYTHLKRRLSRDSHHVIVVDQTRRPISLPPIHKSLIYIHVPSDLGLSQARNTAHDASPSKLVAFIDDDCIIGDTYTRALSMLDEASLRKKNIAMVFGRTEAYKPMRHKSLYCPCTFMKNSNRVIKTIQDHSVSIGYGNNMVIRSDVIKHIGGFKKWLGAGSVGESAEDAEFIIRCLLAGYTIGYNNRLLVQHNRWLGEKALSQQMSRYRCGGLAAYGFYYFQGVDECKNIVKAHLHESFQTIQARLHKSIRHPKKFLFYLFANLIEIYFICKGIIIAFIYAKLIPIPSNENVVKRFYRQTQST